MVGLSEAATRGVALLEIFRKFIRNWKFIRNLLALLENSLFLEILKCLQETPVLESIFIKV